MKKIKNVLSVIALAILFAGSIKAQVTKAQVDKMIKETGLDVSNMKYELLNFTFGNISDGTIKRELIQEQTSSNVKTLSIIESGIEIRTYKELKVASIVYIPFSDIKRITVRQSSLVILLNE